MLLIVCRLISIKTDTIYEMEKPKLLVQIGKKISAIRKTRDLSQESLADECNLHRTYIGSVERGERNISIISLKKICDALEVSLADLFENN